MKNGQKTGVDKSHICDCKSNCGDDPRIQSGEIKPCSDFKKIQIGKDIQTLNFGEDASKHYVVKAAHAMVSAHGSHETLIPAVEEVRREFPLLDSEQLTLMWVGINAKVRSFNHAK